MTDVAFNQGIHVPNYKKLIKMEFQFGDGTVNGQWYFDNWVSRGHFNIPDSDTNRCYYVDVNGGVAETLYIQSYGNATLQSVTFYYRQTASLDWNVEDGYHVISQDSEVKMYQDYSFVVTWDSNVDVIPTIIVNNMIIAPQKSEDASAMYTIPVEDNSKIEVCRGSAIVLSDVKSGEEIDLSEYDYANIVAVGIQLENGNGSGCLRQNGWSYQVPFSESNLDSWNFFKTNYQLFCNNMTINAYNAAIESVTLYFSGSSPYTSRPLMLSKMNRNVLVFLHGNNSTDISVLDSNPTTTTVTTTEPAASTTTTTTTTEPAPIAASENGLNVGLDAESAAVCDIQFDTPLFDQTGACRFVITPKDGYTLTNAYAVRVGTVTLSKKSNYTVQTQQWFFWKSKGMTNYTIHVSGVVADSAG